MCEGSDDGLFIDREAIKFGIKSGVASATIAIQTALNAIPEPKNVEARGERIAMINSIMEEYQRQLDKILASNGFVDKAFAKAAASANEGGAELLAGELP